MQIVELEANGVGVVDLGGSRQRVDLSLIDSPALGDHVLIHAGFAIEKLDAVDARERIEMLMALADPDDGVQPPESLIPPHP